MWLKKITVSHKREECIGCGSCVLLNPNNRTMDEDDGKATLRWSCQKWKQFMTGSVDEDDLEYTKQAADACPVNIIRISGYNG
jgi:ferredoxin